jgi:hypothetical protein
MGERDPQGKSPRVANISRCKKDLHLSSPEEEEEKKKKEKKHGPKKKEQEEYQVEM